MRWQIKQQAISTRWCALPSSLAFSPISWCRRNLVMWFCLSIFHSIPFLGITSPNSIYPSSASTISPTYQRPPNNSLDHMHTIIFLPAFLDSSSCWNTNPNRRQPAGMHINLFFHQPNYKFSQVVVHTQERVYILATVCWSEIYSCTIYLRIYSIYISADACLIPDLFQFAAAATSQ
jgi:hypothetical protein